MRGYESAHPLFDGPGREAPVSIPCNSTVAPSDVPRLQKQHHAILAALATGPQTNLQLGMICQRFGARLNELKKAGYPWAKEHVSGGLWSYRLLDRGTPGNPRNGNLAT